MLDGRAVTTRLLAKGLSLRARAATPAPHKIGDIQALVVAYHITGGTGRIEKVGVHYARVGV